MRQMTLCKSAAPGRVYWLDQCLIVALSTWTTSKFSLFHWICLLFLVGVVGYLLVLVGVEFPLCAAVTPS